MQTNLIGQYVQEGFSGALVFNEIVAVYVDRGEIQLVARNTDNLLYQRSVCGAYVVAEVPK